MSSSTYAVAISISQYCSYSDTKRCKFLTVD